MPPGSPPSAHNGAVNQWKWVNQFQPQTLYMATILCYVDAVFGLLFGVVATSVVGLIADRGARRPAASASPTRRSGATRSPSAARSLQVVMLFAVFGTDVFTLPGRSSASCSTARSSRCCSTR